LSFSEIDELSDEDLTELFIKQEDVQLSEKVQTLHKLFPSIDKELKRKGVTRKLLWEEYKRKLPDGVCRSQFNMYFSLWKSRIIPSMRKEHKAGDKLFIDFAGEKLSFTDSQTGESVPVEVFVAILGASQLTFVQAVMSQKKEDFIPACEDALHYIGGVPAAIVPDNLKSAVTKSNKYEPTINETFADFAEHYSTTILPARAYKPKDKATVEVVIRIIYMSIYAKIREQNFYSLEDLNKAIAFVLEEHNNGIQTGRDFSRRSKFEEIERKALVPLPIMRYEFKRQNYGSVFKHGHVCLTADKHYYSVPHRFIGKKVKVIYTRYNVEIFYEYERIALHKRKFLNPFQYTTDVEHLLPAHRFINELTPERLLLQAGEIHKDVQLYISKILHQRNHAEQAIKICLGVLSFVKKVGNERLISACQRALEFGIYRYSTIKKILEKGLEKQEQDLAEPEIPNHENIRGSGYYK
jgi:transposase